VYKEVEENKWELIGDKITPADGIDGDLFGFSVDIDKSTLVIGSRVGLLYRDLLFWHGNDHFIDNLTIDHIIECLGRWQ